MFLTHCRRNTGLESLFGNDVLPVLQKFFDTEGTTGGEFRVARTNVSETDKTFILTLEMPGLTKDHIDVAIEDDHIVITGEKTEEKKEDEGSVLRREIRSERFRRSFLLDASVDREGIKAKIKDGVLTITLAKRAESVGRKVIVD